LRKFIIRILSKIIALFKFNKKSNKSNSKKATSTFLLHETSPLDLADKDLIDNDISENDKKELKQYTKKVVTSVLIFTFIWITWSYILSTYAMIVYGNTEIAENLSIQACITGLGTILGYCAKSLLETYAKKKNEQELLFKQMDDINNNVFNTNTDEEAVG
jgi:hypothetical protein